MPLVLGFEDGPLSPGQWRDVGQRPALLGPWLAGWGRQGEAETRCDWCVLGKALLHPVHVTELHVLDAPPHQVVLAELHHLHVEKNQRYLVIYAFIEGCTYHRLKYSSPNCSNKTEKQEPHERAYLSENGDLGEKWSGAIGMGQTQKRIRQK